MVVLRIERVGAQILREISNQVYGELYKQIRELVSNSADAGATEFVMRVSPDFRDITFEDNGRGMDAVDIEDQFVSLAVSTQSKTPGKIGRKGVGKFSILGISKNFVIETRKRYPDGRLSEKIVRVNFSFDEACAYENSTRPLSDIDVCTLTETDASKGGASFTRILCKSVEPQVSEELRDIDSYQKLLRRLRRVLPLAYDPRHPALERLEPSTKELMLKTGVPVIRVFVNSPHDSEGRGRLLTRLLWGEDLQVEPIKEPPHPINFPLQGKPNVRVYGYVIDTLKKQDPFWHGLMVRVKNVAVEEHAFFGYSDMPVMGRLTGELNIQGIDDISSITMDRSSFNPNHPEYVEIRKTMYGDLHSFGQLVRARSNLYGKVKKAEDQCKCFQRARFLVQNAYNTIVDEKLGEQSQRGELDGYPEVKLIDLFEKITEPGIRIQDVREDTKEEESRVYPRGEEAFIAVPSPILETKTYLGEHDSDDRDEWTYVFVRGAPSDPPCLIDSKRRTITLNVGHGTVKIGDTQAIRIVVLLTLCYLKYGNDSELMYQNLLRLLTFESESLPKGLDI